MTIQYYSYKIEFQLRGASHVHGVLWVDWNRLEILPKNDVKKLTDAFKRIKQDEKLSPHEKELLTKFADEFITCSLKDPRTKKDC